MNNRKTSKEHEEYLAVLYGGKVSSSSGAAVTDKYDVWTPESFIEAKSVGGPGNQPVFKNRIIKYMEKIANNAWEVGKMPVVSYRVFDPESKLAKGDGYVYFSARLASDDAHLEAYYSNRSSTCNCGGECGC